MATGAHGTDQDTASRDDVTAEWRDDHLPSFFARWHRQNEALLQETTAAIIAEAAVAPGFTVLDVACGSGIPALEIARVVGLVRIRHGHRPVADHDRGGRGERAAARA